MGHPGGPFWRGKDRHAWSIPKGEPDPGEDLLAAARREFAEEIGWAPDGTFVPLAPRRRGDGKLIHIWAVEGDGDESALRSNTFTMEWPPRSGRIQSFPEIDRAAWFAIDDARAKIHKNQVVFLDELAMTIAQRGTREK